MSLVFVKFCPQLWELFLWEKSIHGIAQTFQPFLRHRTLIDWLMEEGLQKNLLEPCLWMKRSNGQDRETLILVEVDDLIVAAEPGRQTRLPRKLNLKPAVNA